MWAPHQEQDPKIKTSPKFVGDDTIGVDLLYVNWYN
jgi:hypothetical protein